MRTVPRLTASLVLLLCGALLPACSTDDGITVTEATSIGGMPVYNVTKERHGQTVQLTTGQTLAVVLPNKVGSSRRWTPEPTDASVLVRTSGTQTIGPRTRGGLIGGAAGHEKVHFKAMGPGTTTLRLTLQKRPQEGGGRVVFEITVAVSGAPLRR